jgi:DNA-binding LytR/AlgR family response regulator
MLYFILKGDEKLKIRIEITDNIEEDEVIIKCKELNSTIKDIQKIISEKTSKMPGMVFYKEKDEYYFPLVNILFFETDNDTVYAHTAADVFKTNFKLYELQNFLPGKFVRISKSAIVNTVHILSISRNIASSSLIKFHKSHKQIYVSRLYYKDLKQKLSERSL